MSHEAAYTQEEHNEKFRRMKEALERIRDYDFPEPGDDIIGSANVMQAWAEEALR